MTPTEASKLFEEKIELLREKRNQADLETRSAVESRDKVQHEISQLQSERTTLTQAIEQLKQDDARIRASLVEHRKNVEASLTKQEQQAAVTFQKAQEAEAKAKQQAHAVRQLLAQVNGIKQTCQAELASAAQSVAAILTKAQDALAQIPEGPVA